MPNFDYEKQKIAEGYSLVCGCDEAGRGPLCGSVVAAAVILPLDCEIEGLNDSKKLTEKKREALFDIICEKALAFGIAEATPEEIDEINILNASMLAMQRAIEKMGVEVDCALIDGNRAKGFSVPAFPIVKGDAKSCSIAAASILAKVTRDRMCLEQDLLYPQYNIKKHKGYPTKEHMDAVRMYGPSPIHRRTFLKFLDED